MSYTGANQFPPGVPIGGVVNTIVQEPDLTSVSPAPPAESALTVAARPGPSAMIVFESVTKVYEPDVVALNDVTFHIDKGEFVFVVGASGSGKSTLVRLLLKELDASEGKIIVGGRDLTRLKRNKVPMLRRNIGCVFQDFKLLPTRTAAENVAYALKVQGESSASIRREGARGARHGRPLAQDGVASERAVRRRAAARVDRARVRQPPAAARLRRADRATSTRTRASGSCSCCTGSTAPGRRS